MESVFRYSSPTPEDVARFLGRPGDRSIVDAASIHLTQISAMARAYTRYNGFRTHRSAKNPEYFSVEPNDEIAAVIILATARLVTNPAQLNREESDGYSATGGFSGWTLAERLVLDRYRAKAG